MTNAEKFKFNFGLHATEIWAMSEESFLSWLNSAYEKEGKKGKWNEVKLLSRDYGKIYYQHDCCCDLYEFPYSFCPNCGMEMGKGEEYDIIKNIPSAELKERTAKVSNQIFNNSNPYTVGAWIGTCECGELVSYLSKYCHMCGAKLDWSE